MKSDYLAGKDWMNLTSLVHKWTPGRLTHIRPWNAEDLLGVAIYRDGSQYPLTAKLG
jgi:hypothetical protein